MSAKRLETRSSGKHLALIGVVVAGMAICTSGIGKVAISGQWLTFPGLAGTLLGLAILAVVGARLMGRELPYVRTDGDAIKAVVVIGIAKVAIALLFLGA